MGRINWSRVVLGGLLAGLVLNVVDWLVFGVWLGKDYAAAMQAHGNQGSMNSLIGWFVFLDFVYGITLVWVYAAIRPRFGAGVKTGIIAGFAVWFLIAFLHALGEAPMGLLPQRLYTLSTIAALVEMPIATVIGAYLYTEPTT
jgi:hypothetical protein